MRRFCGCGGRLARSRDPAASRDDDITPFPETNARTGIVMGSTIRIVRPATCQRCAGWSVSNAATCLWHPG